MEWEVIIGLEIHVQLATQSKIFSGAATAYGSAPNAQACAIDLGLPGILPVLNQEAVNMAIKFGLAVDAELAEHSVFARKNYFYPDLPKGYQISQFESPIISGGKVPIVSEDGKEKIIGITRAHLEEDAGKSMHGDFQGQTGIDLNRAGTPLLEIVSEPDIRSAREAIAYMKTIHTLVCYLDICDGNMQEGSFRCDANVSVRPRGQQQLGTRIELKNINSFRNVERAIHIETNRQIGLIEDGGTVLQETRLYDADRNETRSMRNKEEANDYRYFPDPDLLPLLLTGKMIARIRATLPELPDIRRNRFINDINLSPYDASVLTSSREMADYFEAVVAATHGNAAKLCANWIITQLSGALNKAGLTITDSPISAEQLGGLLMRINDKTISGNIAREVFDDLWHGKGSDADTIIAEKGLQQMTDISAIEALINQVLAEHFEQIEEYRNGKTQLLGFFVGQVMKLSKGKADPAHVNVLLKTKLTG